MHPEAYEAVTRMAAQTGTRFHHALALDIGGQAVNGDAHAAFPASVHWTVLDQTDGPEVDITADARTWRHGAHQGSYDLVLSTELLEHCEGWPAVLDTAAYVLADDGWLILTCAAHNRPRHGANGDPEPLAGEWYEGVVPERLRAEVLTRPFPRFRVDYRAVPGDCYLIAQRGPR